MVTSLSGDLSLARNPRRPDSQRGGRDPTVHDKPGLRVGAYGLGFGN